MRGIALIRTVTARLFAVAALWLPATVAVRAAESQIAMACVCASVARSMRMRRG